MGAAVEADMYFTKSSLDAYDMCPLRFRRIYIDRLYWKSGLGRSMKDREAIKRGRDFHLIAQRYFSGVDSPEKNDETLGMWFESLKEFVDVKDSMLLPEYEVKYSDSSRRIKAKFDLVVIRNDGSLTIYDWKTEDRKPDLKYLDRCNQTVIYMNAAYKFSNRLIGKEILPENLKMVYWNPIFVDETVEIGYSNKRLVRDEEILSSKIDSIMALSYEDFSPTEDRARCSYCEFNFLCNNKCTNFNLLENVEPEDIDFDEIDEIII